MKACFCRSAYTNLSAKSPFHKVLVLIPILFALSGAQEMNLLRSILPIRAPVISDNKMIYTFNLLFRQCPEGTWSFYDSANRQLIIEFYDSFTSVADSLSIKGQMPVKEIEIKNVATSIVPSGKKTQIILHVKELMRCKSECFGDTLRLTLWKELQPKAGLKKKKNISYIVIPAIVVIAAAGLLGGIYLFSQ